jgi:glutamate formiminotransferase
VCAANVSEGRDPAVLDALRSAAGTALLDVHVDADHHRAVLTVAGRAADLVARVLALAAVAVAAVDLRDHRGAHPRLGALDVVPFTPLAGTDLSAAIAAREAAIVGIATLGIPVFRFGPEGGGPGRSLPDVRREAFVALEPAAGPSRPHPTAGATSVGARRPLVAWNCWLQGTSPEATRRVAAAVRGPDVRALGFEVRGATQVSCNLVAPLATTPLDAYRAVEAALPPGAHVVRCELVGLAPTAVLDAVPEAWWDRLDLDVERTVERRATAAGILA